MFQSVNFTDFRDAFRRMDRIDTFSREGAQILFDFLESYEEETGERIELDVIAFCCDYTEQDAETIAQDYRIDISDADGDAKRIDDIVRDYLENHTMLIGQTQFGFVYANF